MKVDFTPIPAPVVRLCRRLEEAGHEAHLVGGAVRDLLLGRPAHDWDVATSARPEQVARLFTRTIPTGIKHGTVTVLCAGGELPVEVTTWRGEGAYSDGRRPDEVVFVPSLEEDLQRRDFTVNAMALDPLRRRLVDPLGGAEDLRRRLIRAVGTPEQRFGEDGLRVMRAVRFAAVLQFDLQERTFAAIEPALPVFRKVSVERVRDELLKLLAAPRPSVGLELMRDSGLLQEVLPEVMAGDGMAQNRYHSRDVLGHTLEVVDGVGEPVDPILRLAALLHDVGKPVRVEPHPDRPGEMRFHRHERVGADMARDICLRLKLSNAERDRVTALVLEHGFPVEGWSGPGMRRFVRRVGPELLDDLLRLKRADSLGKVDTAQRLERVEELAQRLVQIQRQAPPLSTAALALDGRKLMAHLGIRPGPLVGKVMRALLERVLDDPALNEEQLLLDMAQQIHQELATPGQGE